ncbi:MAG: FMN-binding domain protein [Marinimicrobia bacterium 46_47]|nr:MAG: FMN-binding domain protein [Marinimicrobia bacterium 46_47]KUK92341.1 MAG: FMN-binding domain protein [Marinimicrobia bacterium 46_43]
MKPFPMYLFGGLMILFMLFTSCARKELTQVRTMEILPIPVQAIPDGRYEGRFTYSNFEYAVEVLVDNHQITGIRVLQNRISDYAKKAEEVLEKVVNEQKTDVEAVTGATTTSKVLLKAVENALMSAME